MLTEIENSDSTPTPLYRRGKVRAQFGELTISSDFDSGNLDRVEECKSPDADSKAFNIWTAPDCAGTEFENSNRTWFYFTVATPANYGYKNLRFNIQNLNKQSRLYQQGLTPMIKTYPGKGTWERLRDRPEHEPAEGGGLKLSFQLTLSENRRQTTHVAFCYPFTYSDCQKMLSKLETKHGSEKVNQNPEVIDTSNANGDCSSSLTADNSIYFHRELLCYSIENRRIDLVTVSSWEGISEEREPPIQGLFPDKDCVRARSFRNKKVFYVTSRVHPGESPSSHVFNGFLQFILRTDDPRAQLLRRHFVFKLIPLLNPDGVFHGHYRTDTRGMNLNRVYLDPSPELHPSIFAARSLLLHHHKKRQHSNLADTKTVLDLKKQGQSVCDCVSTSHVYDGEGERGGGGSESKLLSVSERGCTCACSFTGGLSGWCGNETASHTRDDAHSNFSLSVLRQHQQRLHSSSVNAILSNTSKVNHHMPPRQHGSPGNKLTSSSPAIMTRNEQPPSTMQQSVSASTSTLCDTCSKDDVPCKDKNKLVECSSLPEALLATKQSGIAFYVDLHAHATKRGVFMYGNYFSNAAEQAENMLFPKLISLNSPHLDFEHCVFSEKNMYTADKRDGMSKEGSGRVAMYKAMGHIHCYTLECNYNSGRQGNALTPATLDNGRASPPLPPSPMGHRFSIQDFEQVGRALAVSALDMFQLNPWSRLPTTEYSSVAGVRQSLLQRINASRSKRSTCTKKTHSSDIGEQQQASSELVLASAQHSAGQSIAGGHLINSNQQGSSRQSMTSLPSSAASVRACKVLLLQKQRALAAVKGSGQIAADVARVAESKRRPRNRQVQLKVGLSPYAPLKRANLKKSVSTSLQRHHLTRQGQANTMKPSLQQVVFPLCQPLRLQTDQREALEEPTAAFGVRKAAVEPVSQSLSPCSIKAPGQPQRESSQQLPLKRKKLLNRKSRNVVFKQSNSRAIDITQKESYLQDTSDASSHLVVSDSEIICKFSRPARVRMRQRAFTSTQVKY